MGLLMDVGEVFHRRIDAEDFRVACRQVVEGFCPKEKCPLVPPVP